MFRASGFLNLTPDIKWDLGEKCWRYKTKMDKEDKRESKI